MMPDKDYQSKRDLDPIMTPSEFILRDKIAFLKPSAINQIGFITADQIIEMLYEERQKEREKLLELVRHDIDFARRWNQSYDILLDQIDKRIASQRNQPSEKEMK